MEMIEMIPISFTFPKKSLFIFDLYAYYKAKCLI
jgi:hypothetical protein